MDLYRLDESLNVVDTTLDSWSEMKDTLLGWLSDIIRHRSFRGEFIQWDNISREEYNQISRYVLKCSMELLDALVDSCGGKVNRLCLQSIGAACFIISLKLILGQDLMWDEGLFEYMEEMADQAEMTEYLRDYESDIMRRTGWKGCSTAGISQTDIFLGSRRRASRW